jgi:1-deoxy-D-xylulose-5-phosphate reductoisomerase
MQKNISIFGSTGSIGTQTLDVIEKYPEHYKAEVLTTNSNIELLHEQIKKFNPKIAIICNESAYKRFKKQYDNSKTEVLCGRDSLLDVSKEKSDLMVSALVGFAGVEPTYNSILSGNDIALANKETLVGAGKFITKAAKKSGSKIIAVDSEHSAILQCLVGESYSSIEKLILTASGGPFRETNAEDFEKITIQDALDHPNWSMGSKITIDSATMMNKGLELIEAKWLFEIEPNKLDVIVHNESIIHSMVQFQDRSIKAQLGLPDMRVPISYALSFPERFEFDFPELDLAEFGTLHFEKPDLNKFQCLKIAIDILKNDLDKAVLMNAANEIAVDAFLKGKIKFIEIPKIILTSIEKTEFSDFTSINDIIELNEESRKITQGLIN